MGQQTTGTTASRKAYYVRGRWVLVAIGAFVGAGALYLLWLSMIRISRTGFTLESDWLRYLAILVALIQGVVFVAFGLLNRIVVSPERIEYYSLGFFSLISPWSNAERIIYVKVDIGTPPPAWLVLKDSGAITGRINPILLFWKPELRGRAIPLGVMWAHHEDLFADIRRYAPHLNSE